MSQSGKSVNIVKSERIAKIVKIVKSVKLSRMSKLPKVAKVSILEIAKIAPSASIVYNFWYFFEKKNSICWGYSAMMG